MQRILEENYSLVVIQLKLKYSTKNLKFNNIGEIICTIHIQFVIAAIICQLNVAEARL